MKWHACKQALPLHQLFSEASTQPCKQLCSYFSFTRLSSSRIKWRACKQTFDCISYVFRSLRVFVRVPMPVWCRTFIWRLLWRSRKQLQVSVRLLRCKREILTFRSVDSRLLFNKPIKPVSLRGGIKDEAPIRE